MPPPAGENVLRNGDFKLGALDWTYKDASTYCPSGDLFLSMGVQAIEFDPSNSLAKIEEGFFSGSGRYTGITYIGNDWFPHEGQHWQLSFEARVQTPDPWGTKDYSTFDGGGFLDDPEFGNLAFGWPPQPDPLHYYALPVYCRWLSPASDPSNPIIWTGGNDLFATGDQAALLDSVDQTTWIGVTEEFAIPFGWDGVTACGPGGTIPGAKYLYPNGHPHHFSICGPVWYWLDHLAYNGFAFQIRNVTLAYTGTTDSRPIGVCYSAPAASYTPPAADPAAGLLVPGLSPNTVMPAHLVPNGEVILDANGNWIGDFSQVNRVSCFGLPYPKGWTNASWYEHQGCNDIHSGCSCEDCCGSHIADEFTQRHPMDKLDPCQGHILDQGYEFAIVPQICQTGCGKVGLSKTCHCRSPWVPPACGAPTPGSNAQFPCCWPLVPYGAGNPSTLVSVVDDPSGPPEVETMRAMQLDFSGAGFEGAKWVGPNGGYDTKRCGFDSNPNPVNFHDVPDSTGAITNARSATGFDIAQGSCYKLTFWIRAVPDRSGFVCSGFNVLTMLFSPTWAHLLPASFTSDNPITLSGEFQFFCGKFTMPVGDPHPLRAPVIMIGTNSAVHEAPIECPGRPFGSTLLKPQRGRVLIKAVHCAPCESFQSDCLPRQVRGFHIWRRH